MQCYITRHNMAHIVANAVARDCITPEGWIAFHGDCDRPIEIYLIASRKQRRMRGKWHQRLDGESPEEWKLKASYELSEQSYEPERLDNYKTRIVRRMYVRCRTCEHCLTARRKMWTAKARAETEAAPRTWFATFTVAPHNRLAAHIEARRNFGGEDTRELVKVMSKWFTLYMKRVRKEAAVKLRYMLAVELHADGFPHLHALIHEVDKPVRKELLGRQWHAGFSNIKLADPSMAGYVTKYICKDMTSRVRSSIRYGDTAYTGEYDIGELYGFAVDKQDPSHQDVMGIADDEDCK